MIKKIVKTTVIVKFEDGQLEVRADQGGLGSLTDIWRQAGSPHSKRPQVWIATDEAIKFAEHISNLKGKSTCLFNVKQGRNGGTYADLQIALKYAQWLSPEFQKTVNDVFLERVEEEIDPELGVLRARARVDKKMDALGRDDLTKQKRHKSIDKRKELTTVLAEHGVCGHADWRKNGFLQVTNAQYMGWKGRTM